MTKELINRIIYILPPSKRQQPSFIHFILLFIAWGKLSLQGQIKRELSFSSSEVAQKSIADFINIFKELGNSKKTNQSSMFTLPLDKKLLKQYQNKLKQGLIPLASAIAGETLDYQNAVAAVLRFRKTSVRDVTVPAESAKLLIQLANCTTEDAIYCPYDEQLGLTFELARNGYDIYGESRISNAAFIDLLNLFVNNRIHHKFGDPEYVPVHTPVWISQEKLSQFDKGIAVVPFGKRIPEKSVVDAYNRNYSNNTYHYELFAILHLIAQTKEKVITIVPNNLLKKTTKNERQVKQDIIKKGLVETIIALPDKMIKHHLATSLIVLNKAKKSHRIFFVQGGKCQPDQLPELIHKRQEIDGVSSLASYENCKTKNFDISVEKYVLTRQEKRVFDYLNSIETIDLDSLAIVVRNQIFTHHNKTGSHTLNLVTFEDFPEGGYISSASHELLVDDENWRRSGKYRLYPLDILVNTRGGSGIGRVGLMSPDIQGKNYVARQAFHVLRIHKAPEKWAYYLYMYLKSSIGSTLLNAISTGTRMRTINPKELRELQIPLPSEKVLKTAMKMFREELKIQEEMTILKKKMEQLKESCWLTGKNTE